ncbi:hypothetical protein [Ralstonia mannitolilytica]|uniref:hypothetical protein n=1 Tax=Ralstonia mannitolilytica TaxID=105219 RepID=UPI0007B01DFB|nr:hypothetical protein [Ralstonia mannitolilytica]ANA34776.1 hypothetical protein VZ52_15995 [Ralstonia mannitolilytica]
MGLKTAIRRLCKFLPKSPELATALALDAASEQGKAQNLNLNDVIEGNYAPVVIDEETGEVLDADEKVGTKPDPTAQKPKETKAEIIGGVKATQVKANEGVPAFVVDPAEQGDVAKPNAKLATAINAMEKAATNEALDEIYIRLEADFEGTDLEALMREYRRIKVDIGSLI